MEGDTRQSARVVPEEQQRLPLRPLRPERVVHARGDALEAEGAVLLVVDGGGGVEEVHGAEGGGVDGVLGVVHPEAVGDPPGVGGGHVQVRVGVRVDVNVVAALQAELVVVDSYERLEIETN